MLTVRFIPHSVNVPALSLWINQIKSLGPDSGITLFEETSGSAIDREFVAAKEISPTIPIVTTDLAVLSSIGFSGAAISASPGLVVYGRELPLEAVPTAIGTADHLKLVVGDGLLVPMGIRASHNGVAELSLILHAILGTNQATPFVWTASQAITSGAGATQNIYTAGPCKFNSRLVQGIRDLNVTFGIEVFKEGDSGDVYPSHVSIIARTAKIEFTTSDVEYVSEVGDGLAVTSGTAYFRKVAQNGQRIAPATASHISVAGTAGMITPGAVNLTHRRPGESAFTYTPTLNTNQITISAAAAIPTS